MTDERRAVDRRLARIEGQVRGLRRLVSEKAYCGDLLTQLAAVRSALDQVAATVTVHHIKHCVVGHGSDASHPTAQAMSRDDLLDELDDLLKRLVR